jgi:hypothetical protein
LVSLTTVGRPATGSVRVRFSLEGFITEGTAAGTRVGGAGLAGR